MTETLQRSSIMTANRLRTGEVVYLASDGGWTQWLGQSRVAGSDESRRDLEALAEKAVAANEVVSAYLMDVRIDRTGIPEPASMRERILAARRPTVSI
ncbi:MAG: DUF2849 domain-containing protein [Hyphomicrobiaceae bacterium]